MPPRIADDEYVDDGADAYDAEDFLDDDDSGDEYRAAPSLPKLGTLRGATSRISGSTGRAGPSNAASASSSSSTAARVKATATAQIQAERPRILLGSHIQAIIGCCRRRRLWLTRKCRPLHDRRIKRRRVLKDVAPVQRGIIRHLVLID
ncbi:RNA polymerase II transcription factor [Pseudozyma hubeiensis]|nr:RNA polymerase II transcription factor [Pseudozyma hubeiensis]